MDPAFSYSVIAFLKICSASALLEAPAAFLSIFFRLPSTNPTGSAQGVLLWIQRSEDLVVSAEISMTNGSEQETYTDMALTNSAPVSLGILEDEFTFQADTAKENINVKLNITGTGAVTLISGVLN